MMKDKYYPPTFKSRQFHCVYCSVFASQSWWPVFIHQNSAKASNLIACLCAHCDRWSFWHEPSGSLILPSESIAQQPHPDLPEDCSADYNEARNVYMHSARAAAALLRLCVQKLMVHLGEKGKNINDDIGSLVSKGLPPLVQKSLDFCRVVGNNAVHPGEIDLKDSPEIAMQLFRMINFIVEDRISHPREIEALYMALPAKAREAIEERDAE